MKKLFIGLLACFLFFSFCVDSSFAETKPRKATVNASSLNVRANPSPTAKVIGSLKRGATTYVYSEKPGGWAEIRYKNKPAYVAASHLKIQGMTAKVYPVYYLSESSSTFPVKLTNGLTISKGTEGFGNIPVILKDNKKIWSAAEQRMINPDGSVQFTVTSKGDTFLIYGSGASGGSAQNLVGVHANGKVFLKKDFVSGIAVEAKFLSADQLEVMTERQNPKWNPSRDSNADRHSGIWDVVVYKINSSGKMILEKKYVKRG